MEMRKSTGGQHLGDSTECARSSLEPVFGSNRLLMRFQTFDHHELSIMINECNRNRADTQDMVSGGLTAASVGE